MIPSFGKVRGSPNSHEMRLSGMPGKGLLISPNLRTYIANIGIWQGKSPMYASMLWVTLDGYSTSFRCGGDIGFHDSPIINVS